MTPDDPSMQDRESSSPSFLEVEPLRRIFCHKSAIGFAVCDLELRYLSVNRVLAGSHGIPADARWQYETGHAGKLGLLLGKPEEDHRPLNSYRG